MKPEVILHNSISLDGRIAGFQPRLDLHYGIVGGYGAEVYMAGSNTALGGLEMFGEIPAEGEADFRKPDKDASLATWVIPDSRGRLKGRLHALRRYEMCRDVIILLSERSDRGYRDYLEARRYDHLVCGRDVVDYAAAFERLADGYGVKRILVDSGPTLGGILLGRGLVDEISLLVHPCLAGTGHPALFDVVKSLPAPWPLKLAKTETLESGHLRLVWRTGGSDGAVR